jgi:hypothetical protein
VTRRSFYEHPADKAECLIVLHEPARHPSFEVMRHAHW